MPHHAEITLTATDGHPVETYVSEPEQPNGAAIVVLHEIFGLNAHIRAIANRYASLGYYAVAPATFGRVHPGLSLGYGAHEVRVAMACKRAAQALPAPGVLPDVQAAIAHAAAVGPVGVVGFSWGALLGWQAACELVGLRAAALYYGGGMTKPEEMVRQPRVPVLAHFARHDPSVSVASVHRFEAAHPNVPCFLYDAHHGFNCPERPAWDAAAATLARTRSDAFFARHLLPDGGAASAPDGAS